MEGRKSNPKIQELRRKMNAPYASDARMARGLEISKSAHISESEDGSFSVPSQTKEGFAYTVKVIGAEWACDCPDFVNRVGKIEFCKHIHAVKFWIAAKTELRNEPKPKIFAEDAVQCDRCGSIRVIQYGTSGAKQVYWCKDCSHKFTPSLLKKARYTPEMITLTLDLYFSGLSLKKIARTVNDHFGMNLGKSSIYRWIQTFVPKISEYVDSLAPQLSETWHADELFVRMKGGVAVKGRGQVLTEMAYLWNVMDRGTRFLLASKLSKLRDSGGAERAFREAIKNAHDSRPEKVYTDSLRGYADGIRYAFGQDGPQHLGNAGVGKPHKNNNRIERLNGTLRERVKVQRGWKSMQTPLAEGQRIHYNFVKPHQALGGQTPAQAAGIGPVSRDKWMELLKEGLR